MKRIYAVAMFSILLVNTAGFYIFYALELQQIRVAMRNQLKRLPDTELDLLVLSAAAFDDAVVDDGREVKVKGKMYDIARVVREGNVVKVYCLHDEREDNLLSLVGDLLGRPLKTKPNIPPSVHAFLTMEFVNSQLQFHFSSASTTQNKSEYIFSVKDVIQLIASPPPRRAALILS